MSIRGEMRARSASRGDRRFRAILEQLEAIGPDNPGSINAALAQLRELTQVEAIVCASLVPTTTGWALDRFHADDLENASRLRRLLASYLARSHGAFDWFVPHDPDHEQRNVLVDLQHYIPQDAFQTSRICLEVLRPLQLHRHHVISSLVCDGDSLLAWFGVLHAEPLSAQQHALIEEVLPALQRRLALDRQLEEGPLTNNTALEAMLHRTAAPAFIVSSSGRMFDVNDAGRAMLATRRAEVSQSIVAALAHEDSPISVELTALDDGGAGDHWLAVVRMRAADSWLRSAVARVAVKLELTRRQRSVLAHVVAGEADAAIAAALAIPERAVAQHVIAIVQRAAVDSRAALLTYVLAS